MIYLGGNDGMLHGFDARTAEEAGSHAGEERFAYVPRAVYANLPTLSKLDYERNHRFFVDGNQVVGDVVLGQTFWWWQVWEDHWRSVLVGTLGAGGKGIYALDVTDPATFTEDANGAMSPSQRVLWDITWEDDNFGDLGYSFSAPTIVFGPLINLGATGIWVWPGWPFSAMATTAPMERLCYICCGSAMAECSRKSLSMLGPVMAYHRWRR